MGRRETLGPGGCWHGTQGLSGNGNGVWAYGGVRAGGTPRCPCSYRRKHGPGLHPSPHCGYTMALRAPPEPHHTLLPPSFQGLLDADGALAAGFARVRFLVLDEADRVLDTTFEDDLRWDTCISSCWAGRVWGSWEVVPCAG